MFFSGLFPTTVWAHIVPSPSRVPLRVLKGVVRDDHARLLLQASPVPEVREADGGSQRYDIQEGLRLHTFGDGGDDNDKEARKAWGGVETRVVRRDVHRGETSRAMCQ